MGWMKLGAVDDLVGVGWYRRSHKKDWHGMVCVCICSPTHDLFTRTQFIQVMRSRFEAGSSFFKSCVGGGKH